MSIKSGNGFAGKLLSGLSLPVLLAGLTACGGNSAPAVTTTTTSSTSAATTTTAAPTTTTASATTTTAAGATTTTTSATTSTTLASGSGDSSSCFSSAFYTNGAVYQQKLRSTVNGSVAQESTNDSTVTTGVVFKGVSATEVKTNTLVTSGAGAGSSNIAKAYVELTPTQALNYGLVNSTTVLGFNVDSTFVFTPVVNYPRVQSVNSVHTQTYKTTTSITGTADTEQTQTVSRKYLGQEHITVAAGSFTACKFEDSTTLAGSSTTSVSTMWTYSGGAGAGMFLKQSTTSGAQTTVTELVSGTLPGGAALPAN